MKKALNKMNFIFIILIIQIFSAQAENIIENDHQIQYFNKIHTFKLEGNTTFGYYYTDLYVGTPPQRQSVIVDTGSQLTAFPCSDCKLGKCGKHIDKPYDFTASSSSQDFQCDSTFNQFKCFNCDKTNNQCKWDIGYAEGSKLQGHIMQDFITVGDEIQEYIDNDYENIDMDFIKYFNRERVETIFGCTISETKLFYQQEANGIMGLSHDTNTSRNMPNIIDVLFQQHKQNDEQFSFSLCLSSQDGGFMSVGGYNKELHEKDAKTLIIPYQNKYHLEIKQLQINGKNLLDKPLVFGIDSGTTVFFGPKNIVSAFENSIDEHCQKSKENCLGKPEIVYKQKCWRQPSDLSDQAFFNSFPNIDFHFTKDQVFSWEPKTYFFIDPYRNNNENLWCYGFEVNNSQKLLGGSWMRDYDILFDRTNKVVHITKSTCNLDHKVNNIKSLSGNFETSYSDIQLYQEVIDQIELNKQKQQSIEDKIKNKHNQDQKNDDQQNKNENNIENKNQTNNNKNNQDTEHNNNNDSQSNDQNKDNNTNITNNNNSDDDLKTNINEKNDQNDSNNNSQEQQSNKTNENNINKDQQNLEDSNNNIDKKQIQEEEQVDDKEKYELNNFDGEVQDKQNHLTKEQLIQVLLHMIFVVLSIFCIYKFVKRLQKWNKLRKISQEYDQDFEQQGQQQADQSVHPVNQMDQSSFDKSDRMMEIDDHDEDLTQEVDNDYMHDNINQDSSDEDNDEENQKQEYEVHENDIEGDDENYEDQPVTSRN